MCVCGGGALSFEKGRGSYQADHLTGADQEILDLLV